MYEITRGVTFKKLLKTYMILCLLKAAIETHFCVVLGPQQHVCCGFSCSDGPSNCMSKQNIVKKGFVATRQNIVKSLLFKLFSIPYRIS